MDRLRVLSILYPPPPPPHTHTQLTPATHTKIHESLSVCLLCRHTCIQRTFIITANCYVIYPNRGGEEVERGGGAKSTELRVCPQGYSEGQSCYAVE